MVNIVSRIISMKAIFEELLKTKKNFVFIGEAGSGKSEIAMNFAMAFAEILYGQAQSAEQCANKAQSAERCANQAQAAMLPNISPRAVHFFDMDQTKPLFRSRDVREQLEQAGVVFHFDEQFMDAPTMVGGVREHLADPGSIVILDVGGNHQGARMIGGFAPFLNRGETANYFVINPYRPWSREVLGIDGTLSEILKVSHIQKVDILSNPNVGADTTAEEAATGDARLREMIGEYVEVGPICVREQLAKEIEQNTGCAVIPLRLYLKGIL